MAMSRAMSRGAFMDGAQDLANRLPWATALFQGTGVAVQLARAVAHETFRIYADAGQFELAVELFHAAA
jgi:hypothetical protein